MIVAMQLYWGVGLAVLAVALTVFLWVRGERIAAQEKREDWERKLKLQMEKMQANERLQKVDGGSGGYSQGALVDALGGCLHDLSAMRGFEELPADFRGKILEGVKIYFDSYQPGEL